MITVEDRSRIDEILTNLAELESMYVVVGITASADSKLIMIANVHEYGCDIPVTDKMRGFFLYHFGVPLKKSTTVIKIPERSFIRSGFDKNYEKFADYEDLLMKVIDGQIKAKEFYEIIGQASAQTIQNYLISEVNSPPNSPLTIANKGKSNPLVDTGRLANAISYEIRRA